MRMIPCVAAALVATLSVTFPHAAEPPDALTRIEPIRWLVDPAAVAAPAHDTVVLQLASIARHNKVAISITAPRLEDALALAEGLQASGVSAERIGVALRSGPGAERHGVEVLLDVIEVGRGPVRLQWAGPEPQ